MLFLDLGAQGLQLRFGNLYRRFAVVRHFLADGFLLREFPVAIEIASGLRQQGLLLRFLRIQGFQLRFVPGDLRLINFRIDDRDRVAQLDVIADIDEQFLNLA